MSDVRSIALLECPNSRCRQVNFFCARLDVWQSQQWPEGVVLNPALIADALEVNQTTNPRIGYCTSCKMGFSRD